MRRLIPVHLGIGLVLAVAASAAATPAHFWSQRYGGTNSEEVYSASVVDAAGNVYIAGAFQGTTNLGGAPLVSAGFIDIFIAKYNSAGVHQWSKGFGSTNFDQALGLALDGSGNVYVTGYFNGTVDFGGGGLSSAGSHDVVLAKYTSAGSHVWSMRFGNTGGDAGYSVAVDAAGNVLLGGIFRASVNFGGGALASAGADDIFMAKYTSAGAHLWSKRFGSASAEGLSELVSDGTNVFATGNFAGTVDFGGGNLVSDGGNPDAWVARYDAAGVHVWSKRAGGAGLEVGYRMALDGVGGVVVGGESQAGVDFGGGVLPYGGVRDIFLVKYDAATGNHVWSQTRGGTSWDSVTDLAIDASGHVVAGGWMESTVDFGGGVLTSAGSRDGWIARYDSDGNHQWSILRGGTGQDYTTSVVIDPTGNIVASMVFSDTVNFGGGPLVSAGAVDIALLNYGIDPAEPVIASVEDIGNDQGGEVKVRFARSGHDQPASPTAITAYEVYRRDDAAPAALSGANIARDPAGRSPGALLAAGWTFVGSAPAHGEMEYGLDVPTIGDSTLTLGQYYSTYYVRAATASPYTFHDSAPDSGYSLDNLAPGAPQNFVYDAGDLTWDESKAADFDYFTVYGSNTDSFGAATVVDYSVSPALDVTASPYVYYYVTATDFSGNEGTPAKVNTLSGVGGTPKTYVLSVANYPNPFNPRTTVSYTVPARGPVTVAVYDARGARVATLVRNQDRPAGAYTIEWDGRTDMGATASSGVYFVRIDQNGATRSKKITLLK